MASLLRQLVAGPRARHADAKLDLCYVVDDIIVTSGPAITYPGRAYRNPLPRLVSFISSRHADDWCIFEFRAEGTGYSDQAVQGRIKHFPWPDHHPPPFALLPLIMASLRAWLEEQGSDQTTREVGMTREAELVRVADTEVKEKENNGKDMKKRKNVARVAILHCKAGKGRSGTVACSYLIAERGWSVEGALKRFTERRMRPGWGDGVSIKSQRRWIGYVARWATTRQYVESKVEIVEVRVWGMRDGVSLLIRCFVEDGRKIKVAHTWGETEGRRTIEDLTDSDKESSRSDPSKTTFKTDFDSSGPPTPDAPKSGASTPRSNTSLNAAASMLISNPSPPTLTILTPTQPIILPTRDVNLEVERRNKSNYGFPSVITSTAHCWFNTWFEGQDASTNGPPATEGTFEIDWDAMDGLKGSSRRGVRAVDKVAIVWRTVKDTDDIPATVDVESKMETHGDEPEGKIDDVEESGLTSTMAAAETEGESDTEEGVQSYGVDEKTP